MKKTFVLATLIFPASLICLTSSTGMAKDVPEISAQSQIYSPIETGPVEILSSSTRSFDVPAGSHTAPAKLGLRRFAIQVDTYRVSLPDKSVSYGTRAFARYETSAVGQLETFGLAQFIKGCQYTSSLENGHVKKVQDVAIWNAGQVVPYHFKNWIIDGFVRDPIDWGDDPHATLRHFFYQWNVVPGSMEKETSRWYGLEKPTNAALYVTDHPGTAFFDAKSRTARNISVSFKTCLFKTADVPRDVDPHDVKFAKPIKCFDWKSSFVYDFDSGAMTSPPDTGKACAF